ncbi:hypothetical protein TCAL_16692 [Tigriopus californicus]|uniref:Uncharacterized protein n=1 Tax=Tigriopus californicus TaxID=6832 RepID=A0A553PM40_TIGCA|nr:hypothetical protein TCAL_16692 [Tigriopus californicus]
MTKFGAVIKECSSLHQIINDFLISDYKVDDPRLPNGCGIKLQKSGKLDFWFVLPGLPDCSSMVIPSGIEKSSDVDLSSKQQEVVDGMGCVPSPSCGETKEDDDLGDLVETEKLPKEYENFLARIQHLKRFMNSPENSLASKKAIASQLEIVPLREIQLPMNPESFPKINRKRTHSPQFRSFFPNP